jgi:hypothetical protein
MALDSCSFVSEPVGLFAAVSLALPPDADDEAEDVSEVDDDEDVVPVGALELESLGWPAPVGLFGVAGNGGATDEFADGVTGGVALWSVA